MHAPLSVVPALEDPHQLLRDLHGLAAELCREGLALPRKRAIAATALFYAGVWGTILTYFGLAGQLAPILGLVE